MVPASLECFFPRSLTAGKPLLPSVSANKRIQNTFSCFPGYYVKCMYFHAATDAQVI